jgi:membrane protease YdiL (CAAX protease family)
MVRPRRQLLARDAWLLAPAHGGSDGLGSDGLRDPRRKLSVVVSALSAAGGTTALFVLLGALFTWQADLPEWLNSGSEVFLPGKPGSFIGLGLFGTTLFIASAAVFRFVHNRRWSEWQPYRRGSRLSDFGKAVLALGGILALVTGVDYLLRPERFTARTLADGHWRWFVLGLFVLLLQTFGEEALFKGYLLRVWGAAFPYRWPLALGLTVVFTSLHTVNSDFAADRLSAVAEFMTSGLVSFALYFRTRSLAAPTGVHFANNVFALLVVNREPGGMSQAALLTYSDPVMASGHSILLTPDGFAGFAILNFGVAALLLWRRSPLCLSEASFEPVPGSQIGTGPAPMSQ